MLLWYIKSFYIMQAHISLYKTEICMWLLSTIVLELESWLSVYVCVCVCKLM